ncbi:MAG: hypothetical protein NTX48_10550 [Planctomycetales bacterium]|nr:hypothetical protein [Planctomycetales bacterium]
MIHKSLFGQLGDLFPHDRNGNVPVHNDHWQEMEFEHPEMDPHETGISIEEQSRRTEYLNTVWWPEILQAVNNQRQSLQDEHGESFIEHWNRTVHESPKATPFFGIG